MGRGQRPDDVQENVLAEPGGRPPTSTVAMGVEPGSSCAVMEVVPWPDTIWPAESDQVKVSCIPGVTSLRVTVKLTGSLQSASLGQFTVTMGALGSVPPGV